MREPGGSATARKLAFAAMPLTPELHELARRVSNWGRWGADDQRGTLNLDHARRGAAGRRRGAHGAARSRSRIPFDQTGPQWDNKNMPERVEPGAAHLRRQHRRSPGDTGRLHDERRLVPHGLAGRRRTSTRSRTSATKASSGTTRRAPSCRAGGAARLGIEHVGAVATRGVLLDIARAARRRPLRRQLRDHRRRPRAPRRRGRRRRSSRATRCSCAPGRCTSCGRATSAATRCRRPACRRSRSNGSATTTSRSVATDTITFEVLPVRGPARLHAGAHDPPPRHGPRAGPELASRRPRRRLRGRRRSTTSCSSRTPLPLTGAVGAPVAPTAIK